MICNGKPASSEIKLPPITIKTEDVSWLCMNLNFNLLSSAFRLNRRIQWRKSKSKPRRSIPTLWWRQCSIPNLHSTSNNSSHRSSPLSSHNSSSKWNRRQNLSRSKSSYRWPKLKQCSRNSSPKMLSTHSPISFSTPTALSWQTPEKLSAISSLKINKRCHVFVWWLSRHFSFYDLE